MQIDGLHAGMQDIIAPFVLENLACAGTETRLLDCPVSRVDRSSPTADDGSEEFYDLDYNDARCGAELGSRSYAFVACGPSTPGQTAGVCLEWLTSVRDCVGSHCADIGLGKLELVGCEYKRCCFCLQRLAMSGWLAV